MDLTPHVYCPPMVWMRGVDQAGLTMAGIAFLATQISHGPIVVRVLMAVAALVLAAATHGGQLAAGPDGRAAIR